jgi:phenylalanyl-tRNA synthetase beta chain
VPTLRASKDVTIKEDIVEEIGRFFGFSKILRVLPLKKMEPSDLGPVNRMRMIKRLMAYTLSMREVAQYALFDEEFLREMQWQPDDEHTLEVVDPVSQQWRRPVTTLIPHLFKAVSINAPEQDSLRFFEWARTWHKKGEEGIENQVLAGIMFEKKKDINFYACKALLQILFDALAIDVVWEKIDNPTDPWLMPYQSAYLKIGKAVIGTAGKVNPLFMHKFLEGDAFIFTLDAAFLQIYQHTIVHYVPAAKYPEVVRDVSMLIGRANTAQSLGDTIKAVDKKIVSVALLDFFEKKEWKDQRSLTFRVVMQDPEKTLTTQDADQIWHKVIAQLQALGAVIR